MEKFQKIDFIIRAYCNAFEVSYVQVNDFELKLITNLPAFSLFVDENTAQLVSHIKDKHEITCACITNLTSITFKDVSFVHTTGKYKFTKLKVLDCTKYFCLLRGIVN